MTKRITAKIGEYQKDGQVKGEYADIGVILSNQNGEYVLLNPEVSLAGIMAKQMAMAMLKGEQVKSNVIASIFDNSQQQQQGQQQGYQQSNPNYSNGYQQSPNQQQQQGNYQQPQQQQVNPNYTSGYQQQPNPRQQQQQQSRHQQPPAPGFDDSDISF